MGQLSLKGVVKRFNNQTVLHGLDLDIHEGEFLVFVGPSGCGKSTLLRIIAGLEDLSAGEILLDGKPVHDQPPAERGTAMVFQNYALYPHMTVADNMGFALRMSGVPKAKIREQVLQAAKSLQLENLLERFPKELSGGQRQRVAIGRAIVRNPQLFLFDEPLSNLDAALRVQMRIEITRLHQRLGSTMIYVTHDQVEAMTMGQRIALFNGGKIEQVGEPLTLYNEPQNEFVAAFMGTPRINFLPAQVDAVSRTLHIQGQSMPSMLGEDWPWSKAAAAVKIGVRPEHWTLGSPGQGLPGKLAMLEHMGDARYLHIQLSGAPELTCMKWSDSSRHFDQGESLWLLPDLQRAIWFDASQNRLPL
jgi:multiple sugar transport system ATP-binding protein